MGGGVGVAGAAVAAGAGVVVVAGIVGVVVVAVLVFVVVSAAVVVDVDDVGAGKDATATPATGAVESDSADDASGAGLAVAGSPPPPQALSAAVAIKRAGTHGRRVKVGWRLRSLEVSFCRLGMMACLSGVAVAQGRSSESDVPRGDGCRQSFLSPRFCNSCLQSAVSNRSCRILVRLVARYLHTKVLALQPVPSAWACQQLSFRLSGPVWPQSPGSCRRTPCGARR